MGTFILVLLTLVGIFLIFIILLQRGRGGGLAGALGGAGGQSAFGTKAGDVFTRFTIGLALVWVLLACVSIFTVAPASKYEGGAESSAPNAGFSAAPEENEEGLPGAAGEPSGDEADGADNEDFGGVGDLTLPAPETDSSDADTDPPKESK